MASFILTVNGSPYSQQAALSALNFARAAIQKGHTITRVFFSGDGVHTANDLAQPPQDETHIPNAWQALAQAHDIDLVVCVSAALRRGILDVSEANRYGKNAHNLKSAFHLSGLGQLIDGLITTDHAVTFGS